MSDGNFNIATAVQHGSLASSGGGRGAIGTFTIAQAVGDGAEARSGPLGLEDNDELTPVDSSFNAARAFGTAAYADAANGHFVLASAIGADASAIGVNGSAQIARALGEGSRADAISGNFNLAGVIGKGSSARAGGNSANLSGGNNRNSALVLGNGSKATAGIALDAPPGDRGCQRPPRPDHRQRQIQVRQAGGDQFHAGRERQIRSGPAALTIPPK